MKYKYPLSRISAVQLIPENIFLHDESYAKRTLIQVEIDPIDFCNHNCNWCFTEDFRDDKSLNLIHLKSYLDEFINKNGKSVVFSGGGEPLLYKHLYTISEEFNNRSIFKYLIEKNISIGLITNGSLLSQLLISDFKIEDIGFIRVSLDAASSEVHSLRHETSNSDFDLIITGIKSIVQRREEMPTPALGLSFIVDPIKNQNFSKEEIKEISILAVKNKLDFVQIKHIHTTDKAEANRALNIVHSHAVSLNWGSTEFWIQEYSNGAAKSICYITNFIQSIGPKSKRYPCCHHFGRDKFLSQKEFLPRGKTIRNCQNKVCRYEQMNSLLIDIRNDNRLLEKYRSKLRNSIQIHGFHPYRYCPTAPSILKPFKS